MEQPLGPGASARCPGPVHCVLDLGGFLVAFHSDSACNVFEPDTLRVAYRTSQAETHGAHAQGSAVVTVGHEGSARLLTALEGSVEARELHLAGLQRSRAVAVGPHGVAIAAASTRCVPRIAPALTGLAVTFGCLPFYVVSCLVHVRPGQFLLCPSS